VSVVVLVIVIVIGF